MNAAVKAPADLVGRVSRVLRAVASASPDGVSTSEVARATELARPTAHRLLTALAREGLLDRGRTSHRWVLGPELYLLGATAAIRHDVAALAQPAVRRLAELTGESAFFSVRRGGETVCLIREEGSFPIRSHVLHEGIRFPLGVASAGLAILSYLADDEVDAFLDSADLTASHGAEHSARALRLRIAETRRHGYAVNPGLIVTGSWGMGAAIFDAAERPAWALSLTGVEHRFVSERRHELGRLLLRAAHDLTRTLRNGVPHHIP